jgi:hypothetical protein
VIIAFIILPALFGRRGRGRTYRRRGGGFGPGDHLGRRRRVRGGGFGGGARRWGGGGGGGFGTAAAAFFGGGVVRGGGASGELVMAQSKTAMSAGRLWKKSARGRAAEARTAGEIVTLIATMFGQLRE